MPVLILKLKEDEESAAMTCTSVAYIQGTLHPYNLILHLQSINIASKAAEIDLRIPGCLKLSHSVIVSLYSNLKSKI